MANISDGSTQVNVSVVIPCRNEKDFIASVLDSILANDYPTENLEVIVADGMSDDGTRAIIDTYAKAYPFIRMIDNPKKIVPCALNKAIKGSRGNVIMRMDAHAVYPSNYISTLVAALDELDADNVGAALETLPGADTDKAKAIALATSHPFGVGNAAYRINSNSNQTPFVTDTVPFGCYRKEVFNRIGLFDEDLVRNQDNELNERLRRAGGRIFLLPNLRIRYFARSNYSKLWKMFFQYGYFGPIVDKKLRRPTQLRRYIPSMFVLSLILPIFISFVCPYCLLLSAGALVLYLATNALFSRKITIKRKESKLTLKIFWAFCVSHVSYGLGYVKGIWDFLICNKRLSGQRVPISR